MSELDARYMRPTEVDHLEGDGTKARKLLRWEPRTSFRKLVEMMVDADWKLAKQELVIRETGHPTLWRGAAFQ